MQFFKKEKSNESFVNYLQRKNISLDSEEQVEKVLLTLKLNMFRHTVQSKSNSKALTLPTYTSTFIYNRIKGLREEKRFKYAEYLDYMEKKNFDQSNLISLFKKYKEERNIKEDIGNVLNDMLLYVYKDPVVKRTEYAKKRDARDLLLTLKYLSMTHCTIIDILEYVEERAELDKDDYAKIIIDFLVGNEREDNFRELKRLFKEFVRRWGQLMVNWQAAKEDDTIRETLDAHLKGMITEEFLLILEKNPNLRRETDISFEAINLICKKLIIESKPLEIDDEKDNFNYLADILFVLTKMISLIAAPKERSSRLPF